MAEPRTTVEGQIPSFDRGAVIALGILETA